MEGTCEEGSTVLGGTWRAVKQAALGRGVAGGFLPRLAAGTMTEWGLGLGKR